MQSDSGEREMGGGRAAAIGSSWLLAACIAIAVPSAPLASTPFTIEELLGIPTVGDVVTGAEGRVAWVEQSRGISNVFAARPPSYAPRQVTHYASDDGAEIFLVGFDASGTQLVFIQGLAGANPASLPDPPERMLLALSLADGSIRRLAGSAEVGSPVISPQGSDLLAAKAGEVWSYSLTGDQAPRRLFTVRGSIDNLAFSPDGSKLAFVSDRSMYDRGRYSFIGVFDLKKRRVVYMAPGVGIDQSPIWSPDGRRIGFIRAGYEPRTWRFSMHREGAPFSVVVADAESGEGGPIWTSQLGYGNRFNGFEASGYSGVGGAGNLLWLADDTLVFPYEKTGWRLLYAVSASGGMPRLLTPGKFEVDGVTLAPDRSSIVYWANSERDPHRLDLYSLSLSKGLKPAPIRKEATPDMRYNAHLAGGASLIFRHAGALVPERLMIQHGAGEAVQLSTGPRPGDPLTKKGVIAEVVSFEAPDGLTIPAVLYRPQRITGQGRHPVIVHAHGGSRDKVYPIWYSFFGYPKVLQYFLSRGYFILSVNYRSGTGYGLDFREPQSYGGRGAGDVQDFLAAAQFLRRSVPEIDPVRMVIFGHSYGGHIVSNALARSDIFAAGIDSAGVGDWVVEMEKDSGNVLPFNIPQRLELEQLAYSSSAISKIDEWGVEPILFLHGDDDDSAAMQPMVELYLALQRRGKIVDALIMPGEAHSLRLYGNQVKYIQKIEAFLREHVEHKSDPSG